MTRDGPASRSRGHLHRSVDLFGQSEAPSIRSRFRLPTGFQTHSNASFNSGANDIATKQMSGSPPTLCVGKYQEVFVSHGLTSTRYNVVHFRALPMTNYDQSRACMPRPFKASQLDV